MSMNLDYGQVGMCIFSYAYHRLRQAAVIEKEKGQNNVLRWIRKELGPDE